MWQRPTRTIRAVRRALVLLALSFAAAGCGGSAATQTHAATAAAKPHLRVVLRGQDHTPRVGKPWHYVVRVTDAAGKPVRARIHLQLLFAGAPVGEIGVHVVRNGVWQETLGADANPPFPAAARGQPLVLQATVTARGYAVTKARWAIKVR